MEEIKNDKLAKIDLRRIKEALLVQLIIVDTFMKGVRVSVKGVIYLDKKHEKFLYRSIFLEPFPKY